MKKILCILIITMVTGMFSGCLDNGSTAAPPSNLMSVASDGRVKLTWTADPGVDYWLFTATDPSLTTTNWTGLPNAHAYTSVATPFYLCGLLTGDTYYFAANGRINGGPGGSSSPTVNALPYNAASATWITGSVPSPAPNLYGAGYTGLTTCSNNTTSAAGDFAVVGAGGAIFTSPDGITWNAPASLPSGLDLYAVAGYTANQNNPANPGLRWVAVGAGGSAVYSTDGSNWFPGTTSTLQALRSLTQASGTFFAVGDGGTILSSTDGDTWTSHTSGTTSNLNGVAHGNIYTAVGDSGTILTSGDGGTWSSHATTPAATTSNLQQVASIGNLIVAVGDNGTVVTSQDGGATWVTKTLAGAPNLISIAAESQLVANDVVDGWLHIVPTVQFVAIDNNGVGYITKSDTGSTNGLTWTAIAIPAGMNTLVSSGFGYVAAGNAGATTYAF